MKIDKNKIKRILFISLSNVGDIVLTTPVMRVLAENFPKARMDVMVGPNGVELFTSHPAVFKVISYDKHVPMSDKRRLVRKLRQVNYDIIVDMRNSLFPFLVGAKYRTNPVKLPPKTIRHKKHQHLWKLASIGLTVPDAAFYLHISEEDNNYIGRIMRDLDSTRSIVAVSPGARSDIKKWPKENYIKLISTLMEKLNAQIIMVGDNVDRALIKDIIIFLEGDIMDLSGRTTLPQLAALLKQCDMLVTNDSAPLHIAGAVGTNVLAIFGPTDHTLYGPTGEEDRVVTCDIHCAPCGKAQCEFEHECMKYIKTDEVFNVARKMLGK